MLAAGRSRRLGSPKALVRVAGRPLVALQARRALASGAAWVGVVASPALHARLRTALRALPVAVIRSAGSHRGLSASIRAGVTAVPTGMRRILLVEVDQWAVRAVDLGDLARGVGRRPRAAQYFGRLGIPAVFPSHLRPALCRLDGDRGARDLLTRAEGRHLPRAELDLDTPADRAVLRRHPVLFNGLPP